MRPNPIVRALSACMLASSALLSACGGGGSGSSTSEPIFNSTTTPGTVTGTVKNYYSGAPIEGATIILMRVTNGTESVVGTASTNSDGQYVFNQTDISDRFVLIASESGFGSAVTVFANTAANPDTNLNTLMLVADNDSAVAASAPATININSLDVAVFPGSAFSLSNGNAPTGNVRITTTLFDPSSDPAIMPGGFQTRDSDGTVNYLESYGAIGIEASDTAGNSVDLANGVNATIRIPVASGVDLSAAPQLINLYRLDEALGFWIEDGQATLDTSGAQAFYQGLITRLGTWNADVPYTPMTITGCVNNAQGQPVANARVTTAGRDYIGSSFAYTDAQGRFAVPAQPNSTVLVSSTVLGQSDTRIVTTGTSASVDMVTCLSLADGAATIKLTWGANPVDLDSHLTIAGSNGSSYEIYYRNKSQEVDGVVYDLDVDDISSFGPEITTLPSLVSERYRFVVHIYYGTGTFATSEARVELNINGQLHVFTPTGSDASSTSRYWHVFDLVKTGGNYTVEPINAFDSVSSLSLLSADAPEKPTSLPVKHYAK